MSECVRSSSGCIKSTPNSTAKFCVECGMSAAVALATPLAAPQVDQPSVPISKPPTAPPSSGGAPLVVPNWIGSDWLPASITAVIVLVGTFIVSALVVLGVGLVSGFLSQVPVLQSAALFASVAFGATVEGSIGQVDAFGSFRFSTSGLFVPWIAVPGVIAYFVSKRTGIARSKNDARRRAYVVKSAILTSFGTILIAALASISSRMAIDSGLEVEARFSPSAGRGFFVTLLTVSIGCAMSRGVFVSRSVVPEALANIRQFIPAVLGAHVLLAAVSLVVGIGWIAISGDLSSSAFITFVLFQIVWGVNTAVTIADFTMGVPINLSTNISLNGDQTNLNDSFHLLSASTDRWVIVLAIFAPLSVAVFAWRWLEMKKPSTQKEITRAAATMGFLFGTFAAVFSLFAAATNYAGGYVAIFNGSIFVRVSSHFGLAFLLGCLWGLVGAYGAAFYWGSQRGIKLIASTDPDTENGM